MIFDGVDSDVFQYYLDFLAKELPPLDSKRRVLIVDKQSPKDSTGITSRFTTCRATAPISIPSKGSGYASKSTSLAISSLRAPSNSPNVFATR